jgi:hypothetical protein
MPETKLNSRLAWIIASKQNVLHFSVVCFGIPYAVGMLWLTWEFLSPPLVAFVVVVGLFAGYLWGLAMWSFFVEPKRRKLVPPSASHGEQT